MKQLLKRFSLKQLTIIKFQSDAFQTLWVYSQIDRDALSQFLVLFPERFIKIFICTFLRRDKRFLLLTISINYSAIFKSNSFIYKR